MDERLSDQWDRKIKKVLGEQTLPEGSDTWAEETIQIMLEPLGSDLEKNVATSPKRSKTKQYVLRSILTVAASVIIGIGGLMLGAKFNPSLAENMMNWPLVGKWVEYLVGKPGLQAAIEHKRYQPINKSIKIDNTEITLNGIVADQQTLAVYYSVSGDNADKFVELSLEIPDFKSSLGIDFSGIGEEVRLSEIKTYGHEIPDQFTLEFMLDGKKFRFPVELDQSMALETVQYKLSQPLEIGELGTLEIMDISIGEINASVKARLHPAEGVHDLNIGLYLMDQNNNRLYFDSMSRQNSDAEVENQTMEFKVSISRFDLNGVLYIGIDPLRTAWQSDILSTVYFDVMTETVYSELPNQNEVILYTGKKVSEMKDASGNQPDIPWIEYEFLRPGLVDQDPDHSGHEFGAIKMEPDPSEMSIGMWQNEEGMAFNIGIPQAAKVESVYLSLFEPLYDVEIKPMALELID